MRNLKTLFLLVCLCPLLSVQAQLMKKLKEKAAAVAEKVSGTEKLKPKSVGFILPSFMSSGKNVSFPFFRTI